MSYLYNTTDLITRITYPSGRVANLTYDTLGRNTRITTNLPGVAAQNVVSAVTYAPFGGTTGWLGGNALTHTRLLDQDYRLTDLTVSSTTATLHDVNYGYNTVDQLISQQDTLRAPQSQVFGYDVLDRLETASGIYGSQAYTLDANGNRLQRTGTSAQTLTYAPATNRLDTRNGLVLSHDAVGNRLNDNGNRTFTYNHANRRSSVSVSGVLKGTYAYSALGQRTRKVTPITGGNRTTHFMFGLGGELLGELVINPDGSRTFTDYFWLNSLPVARHVRVLNTAGTQVSDTRTYLHPDHLGTPRLVTNATRQVIWRLDTDPFGDGTVSEDPDGNSVLEVMPLRFPGQYYDTEAGVAYNYFRDYDQGTGRYTQADPIGLRGGGNRYTHARNNTIQLTDPFGLRVVNPSNQTVYVRNEDGKGYAVPPRSIAEGLSPDAVQNPITGTWHKLPGRPFLPDNDVLIDPQQGTPRCTGGFCNVCLIGTRDWYYDATDRDQRTRNEYFGGPGSDFMTPEGMCLATKKAK